MTGVHRKCDHREKGSRPAATGRVRPTALGQQPIARTVAGRLDHSLAPPAPSRRLDFADCLSKRSGRFYPGAGAMLACFDLVGPSTRSASTERYSILAIVCARIAVAFIVQLSAHHPASACGAGLQFEAPRSADLLVQPRVDLDNDVVRYEFMQVSRRMIRVSEHVNVVSIGRDVGSTRAEQRAGVVGLKCRGQLCGRACYVGAQAAVEAETKFAIALGHFINESERVDSQYRRR